MKKDKLIKRIVLTEKHAPNFHFKKRFDWFLNHQLCSSEAMIDLMVGHEYKLKDVVIESSPESCLFYKTKYNFDSVIFHYGIIHFMTFPKNYFNFEVDCQCEECGRGIMEDDSLIRVFKLLNDKFNTNNIELTYEIDGDKLVFMFSHCGVDAYSKEKCKNVDWKKFEKLYFNKISKAYEVFKEGINDFYNPIFTLVKEQESLEKYFKQDINDCFYISPKKAYFKEAKEKEKIVRKEKRDKKAARKLQSEENFKKYLEKKAAGGI